MSARSNTVPLTEAQSGLWYAQRLDPTNPSFNTGQYLDMRGPLDVAAFRAAVDRVGDEAEALALRFVDGAEGPSQYVDPASRPRLTTCDVSGEADPEAAALGAIRREMETPIDLERGPMATQILYRLGPERHLWLQRVHHLATDGYGMVLLTNRIAELYDVAVGGRAKEGPALAPLAGVWAEDGAYRASPRRADDAAWWRATMSGASDGGAASSVASLHGARSMDPVGAHRSHRHERRLSAPVRDGLRALAERAKVSWPDAVTALVAAYCRRFAGTESIVVGVPHMGRLGSASARVAAMVMNVLPLRIAPDEDAPLVDYLVAMSKALVHARRRGRFRSEQLRRDLGLLGGDRRLYGPLVNVLPFDQPPRLHGLDVSLHVTGTGPIEDLHVTLRGDAIQELTLEVDANPDLYRASEVAAHGERLAAFLAAMVDAATLGAVPTATPEEAERELEAFNAVARDVPETTLVALIERTMRARSDAPALCFEGETLDYAALDRRSAALARALAARGAGPGEVVAVALPRSIELVVALVAVLRAGAAYLPLDLDHPAGRIATILENAQPAAVLAESDPHGLYGARLVPPARWHEAPADALAVSPAPDDAAYVIYTSGSTGDPKGVIVTHRAIVNRLLWMQEHYGIGAHDRVLQKTPATFDVSVWEFFLPLLAGGTLVVAPPGAHREPAAIAALIREEAISTLHFVPSMLSAFLDAPEAAGLSVARVFCSGEELPSDLRDRFHRVMQAELHNLYGPTEAAVDVSYWPAGPEDASRPVPIGYPVWNTRLVVLDERRRPVPAGMVGHLYLGGVQLARGYLRRPDLTAERFIDDPFHPGERLYMTGDLARRRENGAIVYMGRADRQVKIRGLRIELGEIEAAVAGSNLTRAAAVVERDGRLIAYVVPGDGYAPATLRAALVARLPDYMVPAAIVEIPSLPVTANGKLDRRALPPPAFESSGGAAPSTATERTLAALYAEVLGRQEAVMARDDFFALGGDSLSAVRLLRLVREKLGYDPGLSELFKQPDVAGLAARIDAGARAMAETAAGETGGAGKTAQTRARDEGLAPVLMLTRGDPALPPLFVVHPAGGICWGYRALATALSPRRTVYGLQSPALDPDVAVPDSIDALAADYAQRMVETAPGGAYHIAGWSVGGIIAQAVAIELRKAGYEVGLVAMLDSYPAECWRAEPEPTESAALRSLLAIAGYDPETYPHLQTPDQIVGFLRAGESTLGNLPPRALDGVIRAVMGTNKLVRAHHHRRYESVLTHVRADNDHKARPHLTPELWTPYVGVLDRIAVPFLHPQLTGREATALIAPALSARMASEVA
ncbi:amino acid adenylation domain-containing protein [Pendulispora albinea]|uniref:Amino acid adenylation domain-containing protein n=1 Tax=Pendulispora albinea TaxID=2741071 RepID=A0ABZ2LMA2_9BACT